MVCEDSARFNTELSLNLQDPTIEDTDRVKVTIDGEEYTVQIMYWGSVDDVCRRTYSFLLTFAVLGHSGGIVLQNWDPRRLSRVQRGQCQRIRRRQELHRKNSKVERSS